MQPRERIIEIAPGTRRSGKTYTSLEKIDLSWFPPQEVGVAPIPGQKWLIFDLNEEYGDASIAEHSANRVKAGLQPLRFKTKSISIDHVAQYAKQTIPEVCRILPRDSAGKALIGNDLYQMLQRILTEYKHGGLLLEDYNGVSVGKQTLEIVSALTRNAHLDLDIIIHMQSLAKVETTMWQNTDIIRLHKTMDDIERFENRIPTSEKYFIAEQLVNIMYRIDKRFYCYIDNKMHTIWGKFSLNDYQMACLSHIYNSPEKVRKEINRSSMTGAGKIDQPTAVKRCLEDLMKYYGNPVYKKVA